MVGLCNVFVRKVGVIRVNVMIIGEDPLDQLIPYEALPKDFPGELVELSQLLDGGKVKEGNKLLHQLRRPPEFPLCIEFTRHLSNRHIST